ncbi:MAG: DUF1501 domain-containing protein [Cellulomonas sp.]|nr:DUF1501 domain-containing protein [Cellulomonas sp.]
MFGEVLTSTVYGAGDANVLVVVSLRGGADGLSMVVPHAEPAYYAARPRTALAKSRLLVPDPTFGLHPAFLPLVPEWSAGRVAAIHAVGMPAPNRSHFDAMEALEDADPGSSARVGWLNRMISGLADTPDVFDGMQIGSPILPTSLVGPAPTIATSEFADLVGPFAKDQALRARVIAGLRAQYADYGGTVGTAGANALTLADRAAAIDQVVSAGPSANVTYPKYSELGEALRTTAGLIRAKVGVRAVAVDAGGWDHHVDLQWRVNHSIDELATCLAAFARDLGEDAGRVTVVTLSEFGRRLTENGSAGVDHGYGNAMLVMGAGVRGGQFYGRWPGLGAGQQVDGDLAVTTDYRSVLAEILRARFGSVDVSKVFPGAKDTPLGFMA